tara:strand:+ start:68 stop:688 length:621 start_codon:yes stop_codon:yes gene_type:complete
MKKVTKKLQRFIDSISTTGDSKIPNDDGKIYYSKVDGSYLTRVGMENELNFLLKRGVTEQIQDGYGEPKTCCIGLNPLEQKWYGWSHRAIFGFGIGSECKKGDCGYEADNKENFAQSCLDFWGDNEYSIGDNKFEFGEGLDYMGEKEVKGVWVAYTYNNKVPNKSLRGTEYTNFSQFPEKWGKGEWTAKTIEDAKIMAVDFAKGVS